MIGWQVHAPDGAVLVADVTLPAVLPAPAVLLRTPYGRSAHRAEGRAWAARGVAFVVQDVRGRYDSDGTWELYAHERADGAALVDAVVAQDWSDGRLATTGGSYAGFTAWTAAVERPDHVRAVLSTGPSMGLHRVKWDPSGILRLAEHTTWWLERAGARTCRDGAVVDALRADPGLLSHLPVLDLPGRLAADLPGWGQVVRDGPHARPADEVSDDELAAFPGGALHVGGWYDLLLPDVLHHWATVGAAVTPRPPRRLVVGPWDHGVGGDGSTAVGAREHGPDARLRLGELQAGWLRDVLAGTARSGACVFEVGAGWREDPAPTSALTLWPSADGLAETPPAPGEAHLRHDPDDPYPSAGAGADRRALLRRSDALRFRGPALTAPLRLVGTPCAHLDAQDAGDWVVRLLEEQPDGTLLSLTRGAAQRPGPLALDPLAVRVPAGSRLLLEITGADFPHLARHLGTGDRYAGTRTAPVEQVLRLGPQTRLELQVVA